MLEQRERITPESFIKDGSSEESQKFNSQFEEAQEEGKLDIIFSCSDARTIYNPQKSIAVRTIGGVVPKELYGKVISRRFGARTAIVMSHHDGSSVEIGKSPEGCGGRKEKAKLRDNDNITVTEGAMQYVAEDVIHEDPLIAAWYSAFSIADETNLPALGVTQDHLTGKLYPLMAAIPTHRGVEIVSKIPASNLLQGQYDEETIYQDGIPALDEHLIPDEFMPYLIRHENYITHIKNEIPNLEKLQSIQNPDTILITTVVRPSRGRLPTLSGSAANRVFAITVARKLGDETGYVDVGSITKAGNELEYPLSLGLQSKGDPNQPFSSLFNSGTVVVETKNLEKSYQVTEDLLKKPWFHNWAVQDGNTIILAETTRGTVTDAKYFTQ